MKLNIVPPRTNYKCVRFTLFILHQKAAVICKEQIKNSKYQNMHKCKSNDEHVHDVTCTDNYMLTFIKVDLCAHTQS